MKSPAFVDDEKQILQALGLIKRLGLTCWSECLFSLKAFTCVGALRLMTPHLDGFAASSLSKAPLAWDVIQNQETVQFTTPWIRTSELATLGKLCDYINFNSLSKWDRFKANFTKKVTRGLRLDPQIQFVQDERYDHGRSHSKLGVPPTGFSWAGCNLTGKKWIRSKKRNDWK